MIGAFNIGSTALKVAQTGINVTTHNVANVHTDGYKRQVVNLNELSVPTSGSAQFGGLGVGVDSIGTAEDPFLDKIINEYASKAGLNNEALDGLNKLNEILERHDVVDSSLGVLNAFQDVANDPTSIPIRENLVNKLDSFTGTNKSLDAALNDFDRYLNEKGRATLDETNSLLKSVAEVGNLASNVGDSSAIQSKKNSLLSKLAEKISYTISPNGDLIGENGKPLIQNGKVNELKESDISLLKDGSLGGINVVKGVLNDLKTQLPESVKFFTDKINEEHKKGFDINGNNGKNVFGSFSDLSDISLNIKSPNEIASSTKKNPQLHDGTNSQNISDLRLKLFDNKSLFEKLSDVNRKVDNLKNQFENSADASNSLFDQLKNSNLSNVNLDEEAVNLMKYKKMYEANAKVLQVANDMLGTLLNIRA